MDRRVVLATLGALLLVALAVPLGLGAARLTTPSPTRIPVVRPTPVFPSAAPEDPAAVFRQPLVAGCATEQAVWVVSDGGGIGRFDGTTWSLVDPTLRSLFAAACTRDTMIAVGGAGRVVYASDRERSIRPDTAHLDDLNALSLLSDGVLVAGTRGVVLRQDARGWQPYAAGIEEDLYAVAALGPASAWIVGGAGVSYRLEEAGWRPVATGVTVPLRAVAAARPDDAVAAGDKGTLLVFDGRWRPVDAGTTADLRAAARAGGAVYVAGDRGTLLRVDGGRVTALDLGTTCHLRGLFTRGAELWAVGLEGARAGVWRIVGGEATHWGAC
ncbi:MAG TPA: hypothetical protein VFM93_12255 [Candidatus Limnocylindria bacterium]|nr:hypothetical protein [Candidatus Limnocylindria bacterium]